MRDDTGEKIKLSASQLWNALESHLWCYRNLKVEKREENGGKKREEMMNNGSGYGGIGGSKVISCWQFSPFQAFVISRWIAFIYIIKMDSFRHGNAKLKTLWSIKLHSIPFSSVNKLQKKNKIIGYKTEIFDSESKCFKSKLIPEPFQWILNWFFFIIGKVLKFLSCDRYIITYIASFTWHKTIFFPSILSSSQF